MQRFVAARSTSPGVGPSDAHAGGPRARRGLLPSLAAGLLCLSACSWEAVPCTPPLEPSAQAKAQALEFEYGRSWGLAAIAHREALAALAAAGRPSDGRGVLVGISDAGIDFSHAELRHARHCGEHAWLWGRDDGSRYRDPHGTHVAGIVASAADGAGMRGVAPGVRLLVVDESDWWGLPEAAAAGAGVINMSWAEAVTERGHRWFARDLDEVRALVHETVTQDVLITASLAQGRESRHGFPFAFSRDEAVAGRIIGVGAVDEAGDLWSLGCGEGPDGDAEHCLVAPGVGVLAPASAHLRGGRKLEFDGRDYYAWDGTSMAAPFVAGAAALLRAAYPELDAEQIAKALLDSASPMHMEGEDPAQPSMYFGRGMLDLSAAVVVLESQREAQPAGALTSTSDSPLPSGSRNHAIFAAPPGASHTPSSSCSKQG